MLEEDEDEDDVAWAVAVDIEEETPRNNEVIPTSPSPLHLLVDAPTYRYMCVLCRYIVTDV